MENKDKPAYPQYTKQHGPHTIEQITEGGLTKREIYAMAAMQGLTVNYFDPVLSKQAEANGANIDVAIAVAAVSLADELLKQLEY